MPACQNPDCQWMSSFQSCERETWATEMNPRKAISMRHSVSIVLIVIYSLLSTWASADEHPVEVQAVATVNLQRYIGKWYEIGAFPMFFQRQCIGNTTAEYALKSSEEIQVTNRCRTSSGYDEAIGNASIPDSTQPGKLKVSFFWPFRSDYWILGLDSEYRWAVVGNPNRKYLWILSRTPALPAPLLSAALDAALAQGYDLSMLRYTDQTSTP